VTHIDHYPYVFTLNAWGGGTVTPNFPFNGYLVEVSVSNSGTAWTNAGGAGGSVDISFVRKTDGGTVYLESNVTAPFQRFPARRVVNDAGGTTAYALGIGPVLAPGVPVDDVVSLVVSGAKESVSGTLYVGIDGNAR
jgi:hypothetical protein